MIHRLLFVRLLLLIFPLSLWGQSPRGYVDKRVLTTDDQLTYFVELTGLRISEVPAFPEIWGMKKEGDPLKRQSGEKLLYLQIYQPKRTGIFEMPPISVNMGNRLEETVPFSIRIEAGEKPLRNTSDQMDPEEVKAFLQMEMTDSTVVPGQQLRVQVFLTLPANMRNRFRWREEELRELSTRLDLPSIWVETPGPLPSTPEEIEWEGEKHLRFMLYRGFWFPKEVGEFEFGGGDLWVEQQVQGGYRNRSPRFATVQLPLPKQILRVGPLPKTNLPRAQSVGQFEFSYELPKESFLTGETIPLTLLVKGNGNISMVPRPFFDPPEDFLMYDPNISYTVLIEGEELIGQKEFVFEMVAAFSGTFEIGPAQMYFYHPGRKEYDSLQVKPFSIEITGEDIPQLMEVDALDNFFREGMAQASNEPIWVIPGLRWWFLGGGILCFVVLGWQVLQLIRLTLRQRRS